MSFAPAPIRIHLESDRAGRIDIGRIRQWVQWFDQLTSEANTLTSRIIVLETAESDLTIAFPFHKNRYRPI